MRACSDPVVSVVIPTLNAERTIAAQLEALAAQSSALNFEVVIADNGSIDATLSVAESFQDRLDIRVLDAAGTRGASYARNVGALNALAPILMFLDADDVASPGWVYNLYGAAESFPGTVLIGTLDYGVLNSEGILAAYGYLDRGSPMGDEPASEAHEVDPFSQTLPGGNFAIHKEDWVRLGGMREDYPYGAEDADLGFRASANGYRVLAVPGAVVHCRLRGEPWAIFTQQRAWARARARLAASEPRTGFGLPGVRSSMAILAKSSLRELPRAIRHRDTRALANNLGISVGRVEGALANWFERNRLPAAGR